jgi:alpha-tubulin suppressor-like RCC1 family protein
MSMLIRMLSLLALSVTLGGLIPGCMIPTEDGRPRTSSLPSAKAKQVVAGRMHSCALTTEGGVRCWGYQPLGALGIGPGADQFSEAANNGRYLASQVVGLERGVTQIASSPYSDFTCALLETGSIKCWGEGSTGNLGDGKTELALTPVDVANITTAKAVTIGQSHACALLADGTVRCWGHALQLGNDTDMDVSKPVAVNGLSGVASLVSGTDHVCAVSTAGAVSCWGSNTAGQCGLPVVNDQVRVPTAVPAMASVVTRLALGAAAGCTLSAQGRASCWGANSAGELGLGEDAAKQIETPQAVVGLDGAVTDISIGSTEGAAIIDGHIKLWGTQRNPHGFVVRPTAVDGPALPEPAAQISVGDEHICALTTTGAVYCWGDNQGGQVGFFDNFILIKYEEKPKAIDSLP